MNAHWSIRIERLLTQLRVGVHADELAPQPVWVTLVLRGFSPACPAMLDECIGIDVAYRLNAVANDIPRGG
jgi:hypothetical protein